MKAYIKKTLNEYKTKLIAADESDVPAIRAAFSEWYYSVSDQDRAEMAPFWNEVKKEAWEMIQEIKDALNELKALKQERLAEAGK